jgi:DHA2 family multidrug resistance protein-like MFS transporter
MLVALLPLAALGSVIGYRRIFIGGLMLFVSASLACAFSHSLIEIIVARGLQGLGGAGIVGVLHAMIRTIYPTRLLGRGIAINSMFVATSSAIGPSVAAAVLSVARWPWLFGVNVPLGIVAVVLGLSVLPWNETAKERFDARAAMMTATTLGLFILAIDSFSHGANPLIAAIELGIVVVIAPMLVRSQIQHPKPFLPVDVFRNRVIALSFAAGQCGFIAQLIAFLTLPFYFQGLGMSQVQIGLAMTPWPLTIAVTAPIAGILCDRYPPGLIGAIGLVFCTIGLLLLAFLPSNAGEFDIMWRMALSGLGFGLFSPPNLRQIMAAAPKHRSGVVSGMIGTNRLTGQSIGAALAALVLNLAPMKANLVALSIAAAMTTIAAFLSVARAPAQVPAREPPAP